MQILKQYQLYILTHIFPTITWYKSSNKTNIYFTFDDGPHPTFTPQILNIMKSFQSQATFFVTGKNCEKYPHIVQQIIDEGHTIGLHSYSHQSLLFKSRQQLNYELVHPQKILEKINGSRSTIFRPPYGRFTPRLINLCHQLDLRIIMWDIMSCDFDLKIPNHTIVNRMLEVIRNGSIVVFHDGHKNSARTVNILPYIIEKIYKKDQLLVAL